MQPRTSFLVVVAAGVAAIAACGAARSTTDATSSAASGLPAAFAKFNASVSVSLDGDNVVIRADGVPDHKSVYFPTSDSRYEAYNGSNKQFSSNGFQIVEQQLTFRIPVNPKAASTHARSDVMILSHTIAPESDSVAVLARYARENHMDAARWLLLTGARSEIERLARDSYFVELSDSGNKTNGRLLHTETFVLIDRRGHIRGVYDGSLAYDVTRLIEDIEMLRDEAV